MDVQKKGFILYRKAKELNFEVTAVSIGHTGAYNNDIDLKPLIEKYRQLYFKKYGDDYQAFEMFAKKHLALIYIIESYKKCPNYLPIKCLYPLIFHTHYSKVKYRLISIKQFELFLSDILKYKIGSYYHKQMRYDLFYDDSLIDLSVDMITTRSENDYIIGYLHILANLYLSEYNYDEIKPIIERLIELKDETTFYKIIPEYFRRQNKINEGISFIKKMKPIYVNDKNREISESARMMGGTDKLFDQIIEQMEVDKTKNPYKPRPQKKEEINEQILKI